METIIHIVASVYVYCTDFIINLANLTGLSYYEMNFWIFCVVYPLLTVFLLGLFIVQKLRLRRLKSDLK